MRFPAIVAAGLALSACSASKDMIAADAAIARFHASLDAARYDETYDSATPGIRADVSRERWVQLVSAVHVNLGKFQSFKVTGRQERTSPQGNRFLILDLDSRYEQATVPETFTLKIEGEKAVIAGYAVNLNVLFPKLLK